MVPVFQVVRLCLRQKQPVCVALLLPQDRLTFTHCVNQLYARQVITNLIANNALIVFTLNEFVQR